MKFICSVTIDLPREQVVALWQNPDHLDKWQDDLIGIEPVSGLPGDSGSKTRLQYRAGKREISLVETIVTNDLPDWFIGSYDTDAMTNTMINHFTSLNDSQTRWDTEVEYIRFGAFIPRLMAFLMPGMFRRQTQKWLDQFKVFAENHPHLADPQT